MNIFYKILSLLIVFFSLTIPYANWNFTDWFWWTSEVDIWIDCWDPSNSSQDTCINEWIWLVKDSADWIFTDLTFFEYVQKIVWYLISFVTIVAVIYIIYAWFRILTWAWDEEVLKKQKTTVLYVVIWILLIWLAYPIMLFIFDVLESPSNPDVWIYYNTFIS